MEASAPAVSVVLPTFNEADSLPVIVPRIAHTLTQAGIEGEIIVVDDDSPDGTADVGAQLAAEHPVRVIKRTEDRGLAKAVIAGFEASDAEVVVVMDADGSHPVDALPGMVELIIEDKSDIVVGSRHVPGGGSSNWPLFSQLKSKFAASLTIPLTSMTDPTTGFMAVRRSMLAGLPLDPVGWKIVLEVVVKAHPARVAEVPIVFEDRELGESKQSLGVFLEYLSHLSKLYAFRFPALTEFLKFCLVGLFGVFVDLGAVIAAKETLALDTRVCAVIGFAVAVTSNYTLNRFWTFPRAREQPVLWSYATYVGANLAGLSVRMLTVHLLMVLGDIDRGYGYVLSNAIGIVLATALNFIGAKYFAFDPDRLAFDAEVPASRPPQTIGLARRAQHMALLLLFAVGLYTVVASYGPTELRTADEAVNVTMARNMADSGDFVVRPSVHPFGKGDWVSEDLPDLGNLPLFPALLSITLPSQGLGGVAWFALLPLWAIVFVSARLLRPLGSRPMFYAAVLLASSPVFLQQCLLLEFEPLLTAFCTAGLFFFAKGTAARSPRGCFVGGALVGLGFLTKMWLIVPYATALCAFVLVQTTLVRASERQPLALRRSVIAGAGGFLMTAGLHLLFVALVSPGDLPHWVRGVYLAIFSGEGVTGDKVSGAGPHAERSVWFYPATLYRAHFYLLPLILFGLPALLRRNRPHAIAVLAMTAGALLGLVALSVPAAKEPLYALPVVPLLYMLAGLCLAELEEDEPKHGPANTGMVKAGIAIAWTAFVVLGLSHLLGWGPSGAYLGMHAAGVAAATALGLTWLRLRRLAVPLLLCCALAFGGTAVAGLRAPLPDRQLAEALRNHVRTDPPSQPSFVAPRSKVLTGYLHQSGSGWSPPLRRAIASGAPLQHRAYVLGPRQAAVPDAARLLARLQAELLEVRDGVPEGYRVFVR